MRVAMMKVRAVGMAVCQGCVPVSMLVPPAWGVGGVDMMVMAIVMTMPMGVFLCLVLMLVFV